MLGTTIHPGCFVLTNDAYGIGKVLSIEKTTQTVMVTIFRSVSQQEERRYHLNQVRRTLLKPSTRIYFQNDDHIWITGRIAYLAEGEEQENRYAIDLPNGKADLLKEHDLYVRCLQPTIDPTEVLAMGGAETPYLADLRSQLLHELFVARAASSGLTGLLSASIALVPHQMEIAQRVLSDPIQRYLLADEVGMGKTIEAGIIIRQCLLDDPQARVVVLAPATLVRQWQRELSTRFRADEFADRLEIWPFEAQPQLSEDGYDLLVIDEAHHLMSSRPTASQEPVFRHLRAVAHASRRLLLLSATPMIDDDAATLSMLNLLDPIAYPLEASEAFRQKLQRRQDYGRLLLKLNPHSPGFILKTVAEDLLKSFPDDLVVAELAPQLLASEAERVAAAQEMKTHIANTYRLHQRLLRTRRKDITASFFQPRRGRLNVEVDDDDRLPDVGNELEEWRDQANDAVSAAHVSDAERYAAAFARRYLRFFEALGRGLAALRTAVTSEREAIENQLAPTYPNEVAQLQTILAAIDTSFIGVSRLELATDVIANAVGNLKQPQKVLAFASDTTFGQELLQRLTVRFGRYRVCAVLDGMTPENQDHMVALFQTDPMAIILIADHSAEEGLNLHGTHTLVHLDLPLSLGRLEQRIGRVDRFGRQLTSISERVIIPLDDDFSPWQAWLELLRDGVGIFAHSLSEMQFLMDALEQELVMTLFRRGAQGLRELIPVLQQRLASERQRLDEQYALDQLNLRRDAAADFTTLQAFEDRADDFALPIEQWLKRGLGFKRIDEDFASDVFSLRWSNHMLIPEYPWRIAFQASLDRPLTFSRERAIARGNACLLRPGAQLVNALESYMQWEDRGMAFMLWRRDPAWGMVSQEPWLGFCLRYIVEAHIDERASDSPQAWPQANLRRRADHLLPPWMETLYIGVDLLSVTDSALLAMLNHPYGKEPDAFGRRDINLASRPQILADIIDPGIFKRLCRDVRVASEKILRDDAAFQTKVEAAHRKAQLQIMNQNQQLQRRELALQRETGQTDRTLTQEIALNEAILAAIAQPRITLDTIGFVVVSGVEPERSA